MDQRLEEDNYSKDETVTLKIPITLPYQIYTKGYHRSNGTFKHEGTFYNLVKQKFEQGMLYVVCVKNKHKTALLEKMIDFEKALNNWPVSNKSHSNILSIFIKDYMSADLTELFGSSGWAIDILFSKVILTLIDRDYSPILPPPKLSD